MSQLEFAHITKKYGDFEALSTFTLSVQKGELISIVGPSGCGKTTALRIAAGFEKFDAGRLIVNGNNIELVPPQKRNMGMVFQSYSLFPHLTVAENIGFGLTIRKTEKKKRASVVSDMLDLVRLVDVGHRYPHQLSGGQQQRVALARALAIEPTVLLLDEPLNALDAKVRIEVREEIRSLQKRIGTTTLFVTHDQEEALTISDRVCVMSNGVIQQVGTPREVYDNPSTAFVATFIGETNSMVIGGKEVLVRPEHTRVVNDAEPDSYRGIVQSFSFAGPLQTVVVRMSIDGSLVRATMTNTGGVNWTIGQEIGVVFDCPVPLK
ncbi:MAG: ABC transporter ATP-binding protein [Actinomycetota bacterium]